VPLGYEGENYYFVDTAGQVFSTGDKALGVERMQKLFMGAEDFLCWAWPAFGKGGASPASRPRRRAATCSPPAMCAGRGARPTWCAAAAPGGARGRADPALRRVPVDLRRHDREEAGRRAWRLFLRRGGRRRSRPGRNPCSSRTTRRSRCSGCCAPGRWCAATSTPCCCSAGLAFRSMARRSTGGPRSFSSAIAASASRSCCACSRRS
jgi:hypothetical protein